jgi:hypothetical protein
MGRNVIIIATEKGKVQKLTGSQWETIAEAIAMAIAEVDAEERSRTGKSIKKTIADDKGVYVIDRYAPESFSYVEEALIAFFAGGRKTAKEIAEYLVEKRLRKKVKKRK